MDWKKRAGHGVNVFTLNNNTSTFQSYHAFAASQQASPALLEHGQIHTKLGRTAAWSWNTSARCWNKHFMQAVGGWGAARPHPSWCSLVFDGHCRTMSGLRNYVLLPCHNLQGHRFWDLASFSQRRCVVARHRFHFADPLGSSSTSAWTLVCCWELPTPGPSNSLPRGGR